MEMVGAGSEKARKPGRPRAIPEGMEPVVVELYRQGYGYRAITRILRKDYGLNPHYSSVRKTLIRMGEVGKRQSECEDLS